MLTRRAAAMFWEKELRERLQRLLPLPEKCIKYVKTPEKGKREFLTHKILFSLARKVYEKREPVRLRDIVEEVFGSVTKRNADIVRLLIEKTLIPCGIVEKLYEKRNVRYMLYAYRFQEFREVRLTSGQTIRETIGPVIEIPREYFPIPSEVFQLLLQKKGLEHVLIRLEEDFAGRKISEMLYRKLKIEYEDAREKTREKLKEYDGLLKILNIEY